MGTKDKERIAAKYYFGQDKNRITYNVSMCKTLDDMCSDAVNWIELLAEHLQEFHGTESLVIKVPYIDNVSVRSASTGNYIMFNGVTLDGIVTESGQKFDWCELEGRHVILDVVYHLEDIMDQLFVRDPKDVIMAVLVEEFRNNYVNTKLFTDKMYSDIAEQILERLQEAEFIKYE